MRNFENFDDAILRLTGFNLSTMNEQSINESLNRMLKTDLPFETFIFAVAIMKWRRIQKLPFDQHTADVLGAYLKFDITEEKLIASDEYVEAEIIRMLQTDQLEDLYEICCLSFINRPRSEHPVYLLLIAEEYISPEDTEKYDILKKLTTFRQQQNNNWAHALYRALHLFDKTLSSKGRKIFIELINKIYESGGRTILITAHWYYRYLGNEEAQTIVYDYLQKNSGEDTLTYAEGLFDKDFYDWPDFSIEKLTEKYGRLIYMPFNDSFSKYSHAIQENSLISLTPLALYAQSLGNEMQESNILWYMMLKTNSISLIKRMQEISGYSIFHAFKKFRSGEKISFIGTSLNICAQCVEQKIFLNAGRIATIKNVYAVRPFAPLVIKALMRVAYEYHDVEAQVLVEHIVSKVTNKGTLSKLYAFSRVNKYDSIDNTIRARMSAVEKQLQS